MQCFKVGGGEAQWTPPVDNAAFVTDLSKMEIDSQSSVPRHLLKDTICKMIPLDVVNTTVKSLTDTIFDTHRKSNPAARDPIKGLGKKDRYPSKDT